MEAGQDKCKEGKELTRRHKIQGATPSHTHESHKNTKLEAAVYVQRTSCRSMYALCMLP